MNTCTCHSGYVMPLVQELMDLVLSELFDCARAYIDDVVIFSTTWNDHKQHLKAVLGRLWEVGLTAKPTKCVWANATCSYLGHVVGRGRLISGEKSFGHLVRMY